MNSSRTRGARHVLRRRCFCATLLLLAAAACDGGTGPGRATPPAVSGLNPSVVTQWNEDFTLTVSGSGFVQGSVVRWNGTDRPTTFVSATQLSAEILNEDVHQAGTVQVAVFNPGTRGGLSNAMPLTVQTPAPKVLFTNPDRVVRATGAFTLRVFGDGFTQGSVVRWNGSARPTTFLHPGELTAQIPNSDIQEAGAAQVTVVNPAPGGGVSGAIEVRVDPPPNPSPTVTGMTPETLTAGVGGTITFTGTGFVAATRVSMSGMPAPLTPTLVSPTELRLTLTPDNMPDAGISQVVVFNPPPGGGGSSPRLLNINNPVPVLTAISPAQATVGQSTVTVRITGTGFVRGSYIRFDNVGRGSGYVSPTELQLVLNPDDLDQTGTYPITVTNFGPGGGVSNTLNFTVAAPAPAAGGTR